MRFSVSTCGLAFVMFVACRDAEQKPKPTATGAPAGTPSANPKGPAPALPEQLGSARVEELEAAFDAEAPDPELKQKAEIALRQRIARFGHGEPPHVECHATRCRLWLTGSEDELREALDAVRADGAYEVQVAAPEPRSDGKWIAHVFLHAR